MNLNIFFDGALFKIPTFPDLSATFLANYPAFGDLSTTREEVNGFDVLFVKTASREFADIIFRSIGHIKYVDTVK